MAVVLPDLQDGPSFQGMAAEDSFDEFANGCSAIGTGVLSGGEVTAGSGMSVNVAAAIVAVQGVRYIFAGATNLSVSAAGAGDRRDAIVLRVSAGVVSATVLIGTVPTGLTGAWVFGVSTSLPPIKTPPNQATDCPLAEVYVAYNTTSIVGTTSTDGSGGGVITGNCVDKRAIILGQAVQYRSAAWQDTPEKGGATVSSAVGLGQLNNGVTNTIIDVVAGDSTGGSVTATQGLTDWSSVLAIMENRNDGLIDPGPGLVLPNGNSSRWGALTQGAAVAARTVASVTLGASTTVTASSFPGVVPGQVVTVSSGTGTLTVNTYVISVSGGNCVLNQAPATTGTATLSFSTGPISGPSISNTAWNLTSGQAIGDGVTNAGAAVTVASVHLTKGQNWAYASAGFGSAIANGMLVQGPGLGPNTRVITAFGVTVLQLSSPALATGTVTLTFSRTFRRVQVYYQQQNLGDKVTFAAVTPAGSTSSGALTTANAAGGIGMWDSGDLGTSALVGGGGVTATWASGGGGAGAIVTAVRYFQSAGTNGVVIDNIAYPATFASAWASGATTPAGLPQGWAAWVQNLVNVGTPPRRFYFIAGINDAGFGGTGWSGYQANLVAIGQELAAISPTTEFVIIGQWYGDLLSSVSVTTVSGSPIVSATASPNINAIVSAVGIPTGATITSKAGGVSVGIPGCTTNGTNVISTTTDLTGDAIFNGIAVGMLITGTNIPANTYVQSFTIGGSSTITLTQSATGGLTSGLTMTTMPTFTLSVNATASATVTATYSYGRGGPTNWANSWVPAAQVAAEILGATYISMWERIGDVSLVTQVAGVTLTAGSTSATVASGGFPGVAQGLGVYSQGSTSVQALPLGCSVASPPSGNTLTLSAPALASTGTITATAVSTNGTTSGVITIAATTPGMEGMTIANGTATGITGAATVLAVLSSTQLLIQGTVTTLTTGTYVLTVNLAFGADTQGISSGGLHMSDSFNTQSGRDGHRLMAETIAQKLIFSKNEAPQFPSSGISVISAPGATPAINTDTTKVAAFTGLATAVTSMTTNLMGTPYHGQPLIIQLLDNGTARTISWGASFLSSTVTLPTTTVASTMLEVGFLYDGLSASQGWRCVGVA
jgi:hypothetical protein